MVNKKDIAWDYTEKIERISGKVDRLCGAIETTVSAVSLMPCSEVERRMIGSSLETISLVCDNIQEQLVQLVDDLYDVMKRLEDDNNAT